MSRYRLRGLTCGFAILSLLFLVGCIERSTVIKVKKDGSGIVHVRHHQQSVEITFAGSNTEPDADASMLPSQDELAAMVSAMGSGVELVSATETTNRNDWKGFELVFQFADINQLVIPNDLITESSDAEDTHSSEAKQRQPKSIEPSYRFAMTGGELKIHSLLPSQPASEDEKPDIGAVDPFAGEPPALTTSIEIGETAMDKVLAKVLADMRIGIFVEIDGKIESTNAIHRQDNLITLMRLNVGKILDGADAKKHLKSLTGVKNGPNRRQRAQEIAELVDGFDVDLQDPVVVKLR